MKNVKLFEDFGSSDYGRNTNSSNPETQQTPDAGKICVVKINAYDIEEGQYATHSTVAKAPSLEEVFNIVLESMSEYYSMEIQPNLASAIKLCASGSNPENSFASTIEKWWEEENYSDLNSIDVMITDANHITPNEIKAINIVRKIEYKPTFGDLGSEFFAETFANPIIPENVLNEILHYVEYDSIIEFIGKVSKNFK
jgi:hypothetical protein